MTIQSINMIAGQTHSHDTLEATTARLNPDKQTIIHATDPNGNVVKFSTLTPNDAWRIALWFEAFWSGEEITVAFSQED